MMKRILNILFVLAAIAGSANAQSLSVLPIEVQTGGQTEVVVNLTEGTTMSALQFNLQLPEGLTVNTNNILVGAATDGHSLSVQTLESGNLLFILYSMDLRAFKDGVLLRIPVTAGNNELAATGTLYTVRTSTANAVSHLCKNSTFNVKVKDPSASGINIVNSDHQRNAAIFNLGGQRLTKPQKGINIIGAKKVMAK